MQGLFSSIRYHHSPWSKLDELFLFYKCRLTANLVLFRNLYFSGGHRYKITVCQELYACDFVLAVENFEFVLLEDVIEQMIPYVVHENAYKRKRYDLAAIFAHMLEQFALYQFSEWLVSLVRVYFWSPLVKRRLRGCICVAHFRLISLRINSVFILRILRFFWSHILKIRIDAFFVAPIDMRFVRFLGKNLGHVLRIVVQNCLKLRKSIKENTNMSYLLLEHALQEPVWRSVRVDPIILEHTASEWLSFLEDSDSTILGDKLLKPETIKKN